jgi:hypothetical protein
VFFSLTCATVLGQVPVPNRKNIETFYPHIILRSFNTAYCCALTPPSSCLYCEKGLEDVPSSALPPGRTLQLVAHLFKPFQTVIIRISDHCRYAPTICVVVPHRMQRCSSTSNPAACSRSGLQIDTRLRVSRFVLSRLSFLIRRQ